MDDDLILQLLWTRAENAIDAMIRQFGSRLMRTARNFLGAEDAEECVNDTYLAVWNAIPPKKPQPLTPYVLRTGRNIALNRLRSLTAKKRSAYEVSLDELAGCIASPAMSGRLLGQALAAYLGTLSRDNRVLFMRRYWFGDSVKDIAADFSMRENTVSVRLNRIRDGLRTYLTEEGYEL